jgi:hypothetical protein
LDFSEIKQPLQRETAQGNAIIQGFIDNGLVPGRDIILESHFANGVNERFEGLAKELAQKGARMILSNNPAGVRASESWTEIGLSPFRPGPRAFTSPNFGSKLMTFLLHGQIISQPSSLL